jgi:uncharacterized protein (DUF58 family)
MAVMAVRMMKAAAAAMLCALFYVNADLRGGFANWFMLYVLLALGIQAIAAALFPLGAISIERNISRGIAAAGDHVEVELRLACRSWLPPLWIAVKESWAKLDGEGFIYRRLIIFPSWKGAWTVRYRVSGIRRGRYELRETRVSCGDLLGLWTRTMAVPVKEPLWFDVYPRPSVLAPHHRRQSGEGDESAAVMQAPAWEAEAWPGGVRDYRPGDPPQRIHWKSFARSGELRTKTPEPTTAGHVCIILNASAGTYASDKDLAADSVESSVRFDACIETAAGIWKLAAEAGMETSFRASDANSSVWPVAGRSGGNAKGKAALLAEWSSLAGILAKLRCDGEKPFGQWLEGALKASSRRMELHIVTSQLETSLLDALIRYAGVGMAIQVIYLFEGVSLIERDQQRIRHLEYSGIAVRFRSIPRGSGGKEVVHDVTAS